MTAVVLDDLSWVTFTDAPDEYCVGRHREPCGLEAVAEAHFDRQCCPDAPARHLLCAGHRDGLAEDGASSGGRFCCMWCHNVRLLLRIEPLR